MDEKTEQQDLATFLGYEELQLTREVKGKKSVKVKCLPVRMLANYAAVFDMEVEIIELCTDLSDEEIDMLLPEDSGRIFKKAHELNLEPFSEWVRRKRDATKMKAQIYGVTLPLNSKDNGESNAS